RREERREKHIALDIGQLLVARLERNRHEKRSEHLHAGQQDTDLLEERLDVRVGVLQLLRLVGHARRARSTRVLGFWPCSLPVPCSRLCQHSPCAPLQRAARAPRTTAPILRTTRAAAMAPAPTRAATTAPASSRPRRTSSTS